MDDNKKYMDYINSAFSPPDGNVAHYTSHKNYVSITRSYSFNLTSHRYLNEKSSENNEVKPGLILVNKQLRESSVAEMGFFDQYISKGVDYYSSSFSLKAHDSLLHEKYGEYCIEIDSHALKSMSNQRLTVFAKVIYDDMAKIEIIRDLIKIYRSSDMQKNDFLLLAVYLTLILPLFKESKNAYEDECRVVQIEGFTNGDFKLITPLASKLIRLEENNIVGVSKL